ncbi:MAG: hypothetical protein LBI16_05865 [Burkholderiales bacterium]|nr:hypothetical protein [Burkholderiales bacterium]
MICYQRRGKAIHCRWFKLSDPHCDSIHYLGMAVHKIDILLFNLVPLIVLYLL